MASEAVNGTEFSNDGRDVIERKTSICVNAVDVDEDVTGSLREIFEIDRTIAFVHDHGFRRIALQFPDELLSYAARVCNILHMELDGNMVIFVLGDTSYGSCCVDEVAAQHHNADCLIHYGRSCLVPAATIPVLYVFGRRRIDINNCSDVVGKLLDNNSERRILVLYDVSYAYAMEALEKLLLPLFPHLIMSQVCMEASPVVRSNEKQPCCMDDRSTCCTDKGSNSRGAAAIRVAAAVEDTDGVRIKSGRQFTLPNDENVQEGWDVVYIGSESPTLIQLMYTYNRATFFSYDPSTRLARRETLNVSRALMKRYFLVQKAKEAAVVGLIVGTMGVRGYLEAIDSLKALIEAAGKKVYIVSVGKLNVAKLANFMEVDVFVLVACPENSLVDSSEYYRPILTVFEMELACNRNKTWTGEYVTDFRELLPGMAAENIIVDGIDDVPEYSFITGGHISRRDPMSGVTDLSDANSTTELALRNSDGELSTNFRSPAGEFLASRSFRGLEQKLGETPVTKAVQGRHGIARGYIGEPENEK